MENQQEEDRLSALPEPILVHILSSLPTLDAVQTMLLRRLGNLWTSVHSLDIDDSLIEVWDNGDDDADDNLFPINIGFFNFVRNVLCLHSNSTLNRFRLHMDSMFHSDILEKHLGDEITTWLDFAIARHVKILDFKVGMVEPEEVLYSLPYPELIWDSLIELNLEFLEMKLQNRVQMRLLRILRLSRVDISDQVFKEIIRGCPLLQELDIYNCHLNEISLKKSHIRTMKLDTTEDYNFNHKLVINCPNLRSLDFIGFVDVVEVKDLSPLINITFDLRCRNIEFNELPQYALFLNKIKHADIVTLSCESVTVLFYCILKGISSIITNWKRIELNIWLTEGHIRGLCCLLKNTPYLEELIVNVVTWHCDFIEPYEQKIAGDGTLDAEEYFSSEDLSSTCLTHNLKNVEIYNFNKSSYTSQILRLVEVVLKNAFALENLVISTTGSDGSFKECELTSEELVEFWSKLLTIPKVSKHARTSLL